MNNVNTPANLAQQLCPVKSSPQSSRREDLHSMIHHKISTSKGRIILFNREVMCSNAYGVSSSNRVLTPGLLLKRHDKVWECLRHTLGLSLAQSEVTMRLLRLWAYYGTVYSKERQITGEPGCSKATFWRTVKLLQELGLLRICNRYLLRPHAQISNLYLLHKLIVVIARYLAEHGTQFREKWLKPYLLLPGNVFWLRALAARRVTVPDGEGVLISR